jgi:hypothetical protein
MVRGGAGERGFSESCARPGPITADVERTAETLHNKCPRKCTDATTELEEESTQEGVASVEPGGQCLVVSRKAERRLDVQLCGEGET